MDLSRKKAWATGPDMIHKRQEAEALARSDLSNQIDPDKEDRAMAADSQYSDSARADNPPKSENWKSIGDLARALAEKAGSK